MRYASLPEKLQRKAQRLQRERLKLVVILMVGIVLGVGVVVFTC